ncbi:hypothetical protein ACTXT7_006549 [Hymenolepis weldensis]
MEQMNSSIPDKDPKDYVKNVGEFHYKHSVGGVFATWYARNRDVCENRMAELSDKTSHYGVLGGLRSPCYAEIRLKLLSVLNKNPDVMLYHLVDEYNNPQSLIADSNMVKSNETQTRLIKKPEIN